MLFEALEQKEIWLKLLADDSEGVQVTIGKENPYADMQDLSVVKATYHVGGQVVGSIEGWSNANGLRSDGSHG